MGESEHQSGFDVRFEWGLEGLRALLPELGTVVVVDVLRFTTAVDAAVSAGGWVFPFAWGDPAAAAAYAESVGAVLVGSLSPVALSRVGRGEGVVVASPNGATCALEAARAGRQVVAGCLRNAGAVARRVARLPRPVGVVAAGELRADGSLRPALEDLLGAGAVIAGLAGRRSPEAQSAASAFRGTLVGEELLLSSVSGRELLARGCRADVRFAASIDASGTAPALVRGAFRG